MNRSLSYLSLFLCVGLLMSACASKSALSRDQKMIDQLMAQHEAEIEACYVAEKEKRPQLSSGRIHLRAEHASDGRFYEIRQLRGFVGSGPIFDCISQVVAGWQTERPYTRGPVDLSWSFQHRTEPSVGLSAQDIDRVLSQHQSDFDQCFEDLTKEQPQIKGGELKFDLGIGQTGEVKALKLIEGFQGSEQILQCLEARSEAWKFPAAPSDSHARWSWNFQTIPAR